tara:strand:- start:75911 stop:76108 length:198 start_codon:yes stop_codon:yes gene_type:complete
MKIKEEIQIELTPKEVEKIIKEHFSDKYDIESIYFNVTTVYDGSYYSEHGSDEMTNVRCVGKNKN